MHPILNLLVAGLEAEEKESVSRRVEAMNSELEYLRETKPKDIAEVKKRGWSPHKLQVLFCLNSFYQRILAPLGASTTPPAALGSKIPIRYGKTIVFDAKRNAAINKMGSNFLQLCRRFQIQLPMLEAQRTSDLIWKINNPS